MLWHSHFETRTSFVMKTLVTGAGGFLGRYIIVKLLLARGDQSERSLRGHTPLLERLGVESIQGDIQDATAVNNACRGIEMVFHLPRNPRHLGMLVQVLQCEHPGNPECRRGMSAAGVPKLIFTSSPSVTFNGESQEGIDETAPYPSNGWRVIPGQRQWLKAWSLRPTPRMAYRPAP